MRICQRQTAPTIDPATLKPGATFYSAHVWTHDDHARITRHTVLTVGKRIKHAADGISSCSLSEARNIVRAYDRTPADALYTLRARLMAEAREVAAEIAIIDATTPTEPEPVRIRIHSLGRHYEARVEQARIAAGHLSARTADPAPANSDQEPDDITGRK